MVDKPAEPPTKTLPAANPIEVALRQLDVSMRSGFREVNANLDLVSGDLSTVKAEVRSLQSWRGEQEARLNNNSIRARQASQVDMEQASQLAQERSNREELAKRVDAIDAKQDVQIALLDKLVKLTEKPVVKLVATAIGTAILTWLSARGLR